MGWEFVSTTGRGVFRYPNFWSTFSKNIADSLELEQKSRLKSWPNFNFERLQQLVSHEDSSSEDDFGCQIWIAASFCHNKDTLSPKNDQRLLAHLHAPGSHQSSLNKGSDGVTDKARQWSDLDPTKTIMITIWWGKTLMNMIWQQIRYDSENCHDNNLMTKPWWLRYDDCARLGFDPGSRSCHSPSTPSHSLCDQTSANCISSLMLKCICNQQELYFFTHAQVYFVD